MQLDGKLKMNKYRNVKTSTLRGTFDSKKEAEYEDELFLRLKAKDILSYECQVKFPLTVKTRHICNYIADFVVHTKTGTEIHEVKGGKATQTSTFRLKWKLMKALYPEFIFRIV